ncbi:MAG: RsmD family RNA methyltransferase [Rickettsiales bacterium]|jgi:16S rRNA (guanine966-N2)-methyltransferase|nr:RsmD family RNA methyltransferase [Rickettsiales bacterium]
MESHIKIISGKYRGRKLAWPESARPTSQRAKVALFNILSSIIKPGNLVVWDAFAGSGAFGAEFASRGWASEIILTDSDASAVKIISKNLQDMDDSSTFTILRAKMPDAASKFAEKAGVIFLDPPYSDVGELSDTIKMVANYMNTNAILIVESEAGTEHIASDGLELIADRTYGRAQFHIYRKI